MYTALNIPENQIERKKLSQLAQAAHSFLEKYPTEMDIRLDTVLVKLFKKYHEVNRIKGLTLD